MICYCMYHCFFNDNPDTSLILAYRKLQANKMRRNDPNVTIGTSSCIKHLREDFRKLQLKQTPPEYVRYFNLTSLAAFTDSDFPLVT
jgi:hypothetical protein